MTTGAEHDFKWTTFLISQTVTGYFMQRDHRHTILSPRQREAKGANLQYYNNVYFRSQIASVSTDQTPQNSFTVVLFLTSHPDWPTCHNFSNKVWSSAGILVFYYIKHEQPNGRQSYAIIEYYVEQYLYYSYLN